MEPQLADAIIARRQSGADDPSGLRRTTAWLLADGLADVTMMRRLNRFITAEGDVHRVQVLGHFDAGGPVARIDAVIDSTTSPPRIIHRRDLSELGPGYDLRALPGAGAAR